MEQRLILVNLLIKLGVAAAVASVLVRSVEFKSSAVSRKPLPQAADLSDFVDRHSAGDWGLGPLHCKRVFWPGDLSFETTILLGVIGGRFTGMVGGALARASGLAAWRVGNPAFQSSVWLRRRTIAHSRPRPGRHLVVLSIYRSQHLSHDPPQPADAPLVRLAGHVLCDHRGAAFRADGDFAFLPHATFSLESPNLWVEVADLCHLDHGDWDRTENLEQRSHSDQAGRAGAAAAALPHGGAAKSDQSRTSCSTL